MMFADFTKVAPTIACAVCSHIAKEHYLCNSGETACRKCDCSQNKDIHPFAVQSPISRVELKQTLQFVASWARGRQKLDDEIAEQGGEEFCDIASRCEEALEALTPDGLTFGPIKTDAEIDEKCLDLAAHFMSVEPLQSAEERQRYEWSLASAVQQAVEDWFICDADGVETIQKTR